jgi:hypothetical protein
LRCQKVRCLQSQEVRRLRGQKIGKVLAALSDRVPCICRLSA